MKPPPRQTPYETALAKGRDFVRGRQGRDLAALGAKETAPGRWELPVLEHAFVVDLAEGMVARPDEKGGLKKLRIEWQILTLHYLSAPAPRENRAALAPREEGAASASSERWVSFAEIPGARGYDPVYRGRVLGRLCGTAGRDRATFAAAGERIGGRRVEAGEVGFRFQVFPRLAVVIAWYAGDDEFPPGASFLYPGDIASFLSVEDVVVLSESVVGRLQGREP